MPLRLPYTRSRSPLRRLAPIACLARSRSLGRPITASPLELPPRAPARRSPPSLFELYGIYRVAEFSRDGVTLPPLLSDSQRWRWVVFGGNRNVTIRAMSDAVDRYTSKLDESQHAMTLTDRATPVRRMTLNFDQVDPDHVVLRGTVSGASIAARVERVDERNYLLLNRGFHWIQEKPFNG